MSNMSQRGDDPDASSVRNSNLYTPNPAFMQQQQQQQQANNAGIPPQFLPGGVTPNAPYWDPWMNYYPALSPYDVGYREEFSRNQMFNQMYPPPTTLATGQQPRPSNNSAAANPTASATAAANPPRPATATAATAAAANPGNRPPPSNASTTGGASAHAQVPPAAAQQPPYVPGPAPYMPYMDPFYYSMLASFGYPMANPYANPYGPMMPPPYGPMYPAQRPLNDDQQSVQSYHYENMDTRSENRFGMPQVPHRPQSVAGGGGSYDHHHQARQMANNGLLTQFNQQPHQAPTMSADQETMNTVNDPNMSALANIKKESESQHRMTPLMHQRPHVRANFSLNGLVQIRANDPCEGQPALVDIINLSDLMEQYLQNLKKSFANEDKSLQIRDKTGGGGDELDDENQNADNEEEFSLQAEISKEILANYKLLQEFPGPLVKEHTSKAQIVQFCQKVVKDCLSSTTINLIDPQSHALLWDYLALLVRQNGIIDLKTDISQLLLSGIVDNQHQWSLTFSTTTTTTTTTTISATPVPAQDFVMVNGDSTIDTLGGNDRTRGQAAASSQRQLQTPQPTDEEQHLNKLREFLGAGQRQDAIELAMKHNMWPHALFLASSASFSVNQTTSNFSSQTASIAGGLSLNPSPSVPNMMSVTSMAESKTLQKVKARFINSLQPNDPINTCYQLLIGRVPPVANNISKSEWNDWRRHLAMIVANIDDSNRELVFTSIKTMGDSLATNGRVAASHFCYLLSDCPFGSFNKKSSKIVLIGSSHNQDFGKFCQINSIQATEIFEYARSLSAAKQTQQNSQQNFDTLDHFVKYKLIYTMRLLEYGLVNEACKYVEVLAKAVNANPKLHADKISTVYQLANRLRVYDPDFNAEDLNNPDSEPQWFHELSNTYKKQHLNKLWHLLPSNESSKKPEPALVQPAQQPVLSNQNSLNVHTKMEPKSANPSPNEQKPQVNEFQYGQQQNQLQQQMYEPVASNQQQYDQQQYDQQQQQQQMAGLNYQMGQMNFGDDQPRIAEEATQIPQVQTQQSMPFHVSVVADPNAPLQQPQQQYYQPTPEANYNAATPQQQQQQDYQQPPVPQFYNPASMQPQAQPAGGNYVDPRTTTLESSRKSSVSSAVHPQTPNYNQHQAAMFNFAQPAPLTNPSSSGGSQMFYNPNDSMQPQQQSNQRYSDKSASRSRQISTSSNSNDNSNVLSFSGSQQTLAAHSQPMMFDPNASMNKSQSFPPNNMNQDDHRNDKDSDSRSNGKVKQEEEDDDSAKSNKNAQDKQAPKASEGLLWRALGKIIPASSAPKPKKMVLPDDKKKTIVWDDKLKRYVNNDGSSEQVNDIKPPPTNFPMNPPAPKVNNTTPQPTTAGATAASAPQTSQTSNSTVAPPQPMPSASNNNVFSLKSVGKRNYYANIDIMGDKAKKVTADPQAVAPLLSTMPPPAQLPPKFFVPAPSQASPNASEDNQNSQAENNQQDAQNYQQQQNLQQQQQQQNDQYNQYHQNQPTNNHPAQPMMYQNPTLQAPSQYYQPQMNHHQQQNDQYGGDESDSATNSAESYGAMGGNGASSHDSSSNESASANMYGQYQQYGNQYAGGYQYNAPQEYGQEDYAHHQQQQQQQQQHQHQHSNI